ncbi:hypothetical protein D3C76_1099100 [compost metagenome]
MAILEHAVDQKQVDDHQQQQDGGRVAGIPDRLQPGKRQHQAEQYGDQCAQWQQHTTQGQ